MNYFAHSDLRSKAKRWDEKNVDAMKRKRNECLALLKDLSVVRRKRPELDNLQSQVNGLRGRLSYSRREVESTVRKKTAKVSKSNFGAF